jgi:hypothetical protein
VAEPLPLAPKSLPVPPVPLPPPSSARLGPRKLALPPADDDKGSDMRGAATAPLSGLLAADGVPEEPLVAPLLPAPPLPAAAAAWNPKRRTAWGVPGEGARKRYSRSRFNNRERASL